MKTFNIIALILVIYFRLSYTLKKKKFFNLDNKILYETNAVIVKEKNLAINPKLRKYKLEITEEKLNFIPVSLDQLPISVKYSKFIFIDGEIISTLEQLMGMKNKYYSKISENVKYQLQHIENEEHLDPKKTFIILIKQLLNESMFEFKFLLFTMTGEKENEKYTQNEILELIKESYVNELANRDVINLVSGKSFCNLNLQTFQPEEHLRLFYWTDYTIARTCSNSNNFYTFLTNEGIVMSSKGSQEITNNVKYTFRYDQIVDCKGITNPKKFEFITNNLDEDKKAEISNLKCCISYNTIWNTHNSSKELFCSRYDTYNQCKTEIAIFAQTIFSKCVFSGISHLLDILSKNSYNIDDTLAGFSDLQKIKYFSLLKNIKKYRIYPINEPQTDSRQLPYDCSTDCLHSFRGLENLLTELNQNLGQFLNKFEENLKELDVNGILNNVVKHNDIDRGELKEKVMENIRLHNSNVVMSKCLCDGINRLVYVEDMVPTLVEMINRNVPFPVEIVENILGNNENSAEFKKSDLMLIRSTVNQLLDLSKQQTEEENNKKNLKNIMNKEQPVEKIIIDPNEEKRRLESLKNIEKTYNSNSNPLNFLYNSYKMRQEKERNMPVKKNVVPICKMQKLKNTQKIINSGISTIMVANNNVRHTSSNNSAGSLGTNINNDSSINIIGVSDEISINGNNNRLYKQIDNGKGNYQINKLSNVGIGDNDDNTNLEIDPYPQVIDYRGNINAQVQDNMSNVDNLINFRKRVFLDDNSKLDSNNNLNIT